MVFVRARDLEKRYGGVAALSGLDLDLPDGEITVILGPSGCGKTTFLRILAGLTTPDSGTVRIGDRTVNDPRIRVPPEDRRLGMVFQEPLLWPHRRVRGNISFALGPRKSRDPRVAEAARTAEVEMFLDRYPAELSGGERQRAAIARAIVTEPELLLMDEPLSGLDANLRVRLLNTIRSVQQRLGVTACYVTHDQEEAMSLADRVVVMRRGRVLQIGSPEEVYSSPRTAFVAGFVGLSTLIPGRAVDGAVETPLGKFAVRGDLTGEVLLAARPETVHLAAGEGVSGKVVSSVFRGDRWLVAVAVGDRELLSVSPGPRRAGDEVSVRIDPAPVAVIDDEECP